MKKIEITNPQERLIVSTKEQNSSVTLWIIPAISGLLILLFSYTVVSKLSNPEDFRAQMFNQAFSHKLAVLLVYFIPAAEILATIMLLSERLRMWGLILSLFLMLLFTGYVGLVLIGYYDRVPCSCGGVLRSLGWGWHFVLNAASLLLATIGLILKLKERRSGKNKN